MNGGWKILILQKRSKVKQCTGDKVKFSAQWSVVIHFFLKAFLEASHQSGQDSVVPHPSLPPSLPPLFCHSLISLHFNIARATRWEVSEKKGDRDQGEHGWHIGVWSHCAAHKGEVRVAHLATLWALPLHECVHVCMNVCMYACMYLYLGVCM